MTDCDKCSVGYFCPSVGTVSPTLCGNGFYCPLGSAQLINSCPKGSYCPSGSGWPIPCNAGSYQNESGKSICEVILNIYQKCMCFYN